MHNECLFKMLKLLPWPSPGTLPPTPHWEDSFPVTVAGLAKVLLDAEWPDLCSVFSLRMDFGSCSYEDFPNTHVSRQTITTIRLHSCPILCQPCLHVSLLSLVGACQRKLDIWSLNTSVSPYRIKEFYHVTARVLSGSAKLTPNSGHGPSSLKDLSDSVVASLFKVFSLNVT